MPVTAANVYLYHVHFIIVPLPRIYYYVSSSNKRSRRYRINPLFRLYSDVAVHGKPSHRRQISHTLKYPLIFTSRADLCLHRRARFQNKSKMNVGVVLMKRRCEFNNEFQFSWIYWQRLFIRNKLKQINAFNNYVKLNALVLINYHFAFNSQYLFWFKKFAIAQLTLMNDHFKNNINKTTLLFWTERQEIVVMSCVHYLCIVLFIP